MIVAGLAAVSVALLSFVLSPGSSAAVPRLKSTTTVKATPAVAGVQRNVHLTATVKVLNLGGAIIFPTGTVTFSTPALGDFATAVIGPCFVLPCTTSVDTTALPFGTDVVTATWSGDQYGLPSQGSTAVVINGSSYTPSSTVVCPKGQDFCDAGLIRSADGETWSDLFIDQAASQNHVMSETLGGTPLKCADKNAGSVVTFSDTPDVVAFKTVDYTITDPSKAQSMLDDFNAHQQYLGCYASNKPFLNGQTGAPAKIVLEPTGPVYEGPLPNCESVGYTPPCFIFEQGVDQYGNESEVANTVEIEWEQGTSSDPKFID